MFMNSSKGTFYTEQSSDSSEVGAYDAFGDDDDFARNAPNMFGNIFEPSACIMGSDGCRCKCFHFKMYSDGF